MGIFDLVFIVSVLLALTTLAIAAGLAIMRRFRTALLALVACVAYIAIYLIIVVFISLVRQPRELAVGENACFDDWCIAVERIEQTRVGVGATYRIAFRVTSQAKRRPQRERNLAVYLIDAHALRYDAHLPDGEQPFDVLLAPGDTVRTAREFEVPVPDARPRLVITHEGGFPIGWFIIGHGPFYKGIEVSLASASSPS